MISIDNDIKFLYVHSSEVSPNFLYKLLLIILIKT